MIFMPARDSLMRAKSLSSSASLIRCVSADSLGGSGGVVHGLPPPSASGGSGLTYLSASDRRGATHLPPLQNIMSRAGAALLGLTQRKGEKEGTSFCSARRMNAPTQIAGQLADDRKPSTAPDQLRCRPIVRDPAFYDVACEHQLHSQFW
jgi:hypothetical protein